MHAGLRWLPRRLQQVDPRTVGVATTLILLGYLVGGPLLMLVFSSLKETGGQLPFQDGATWSLSNFADLVLNSAVVGSLFNTAIFVAGSLVIGLGIAIPLSWLIERSNLPFRNALFVAIVAATGIPGVIHSISWVLLLNPTNGLLNLLLRPLFGNPEQGPINIYSAFGLWAVEGVNLVPFTVLLLTASLRSMDSSFEEAAMAAGAGFRQMLRRVTVPMIRPAVLAVLLYQMVSVIESFDTPLIIGVNAGIHVLSTQIYATVDAKNGVPDYGFASAQGVVLLLLATAPIILFNRWTSGKDRFASVTGRGFRRRRFELGAWRWPVTIGVWSFVVVALWLPLATMVWTSVQPFFAVPSAKSIARVSLEPYIRLIASEQVRSSMVNTLIVGVASAAGAMLIAIAASWVIVRIRSRWSVFIDALAFMPHAFPGVIIGLSILIIYLLLPIPVYGTVWIIVIALATQYIALGTRFMNSSIAQVAGELEEAAATSGASWVITLRKVTFPLVIPAFLNGYLLIFIASIKSLTMPLILFSPGVAVLATEIYFRWTGFDTAGAAALGVMISVVSILLAIGLRRSVIASASYGG